MRRRLVAIGCALAVLLAWTGGDLSAIARSADAMACCAKAHYDCAGLQSPDDCCKTVRSTSALPSSTVASSHPPLAPPAVAALIVVAWAPSTVALVADTFVRPHDPPHLHAFSLLI